MTSFGGDDLEDHVHIPSIRRQYLPMYPVEPTDDHPDIQLNLEHGRVNRKDGYVNCTPKAVPIQLLETRKDTLGIPYDVGELRLDQESIDILREKSGYCSLGITDSTLEPDSPSMISATEADSPSIKSPPQADSSLKPYSPSADSPSAPDSPSINSPSDPDSPSEPDSPSMNSPLEPDSFPDSVSNQSFEPENLEPVHQASAKRPAASNKMMTETGKDKVQGETAGRDGLDTDKSCSANDHASETSTHRTSWLCVDLGRLLYVKSLFAFEMASCLTQGLAPASDTGQDNRPVPFITIPNSVPNDSTTIQLTYGSSGES
jgi:hypothetical protein